MLLYLLLLFTVVPLVELALLIRISTLTSVAFTIGLVLVTGIVGAALARWQGWRTVDRIRGQLRAGEMPADAMIDAVLILAAGLVLVTPGVLTDIAGFALLIPPMRTLVKRTVAAWIRRHFEVQVTHTAAAPWQDFPNGHPRHRDQIIDAEVINTDVKDAD